VPVSLEHQRTHCLADAHIDCPGYLNGWVNGFPKELRAAQPTHTKILQNKWLLIALAVLLLGTVGFIFSGQIASAGKDMFNTVGGWFERPTPTATLPPTSTPTRTALPRDEHTDLYGNYDLHTHQRIHRDEHRHQHFDGHTH
jgi:hypothetical protein